MRRRPQILVLVALCILTTMCLPPSRADADATIIGKSLKMQRVFLMSSERSGSNLVRRVLSQTAEIVGPPPPHLLKAFGPYWPYMDFNSEAVKERIVTLAIELLYRHTSPWDVDVPAGRVRDHLDEAGWAFENLFDVCHAEYARGVGKAGYFAKENNVFDFVFPLTLRFPDAHFVHLVRDPRDVALSFKRAPSGPKTAYYAAERWFAEQRRCLAFAHALPERVHRLRYEDLIGEPETTVKTLFAFLKLPFSPGVLAPDESSSAEASQTRFWENLDKPILKGNAGKYRKGLKSREIACVEAVCAPLMKHFGYAPVLPDRRAPVPGYVKQVGLKALDYAVRRAVYRRRTTRPEEREARRKRARIYAEIRRMAGFEGCV